MGLALLTIIIVAGGLLWCYRVPEADRMYHWGLAVALYFVAGVVGLILEAFGIGV